MEDNLILWFCGYVLSTVHLLVRFPFLQNSLAGHLLACCFTKENQNNDSVAP